ncbi:MAG: recombinase family protein [Aeromonas veronii]
MKFGYARVSTDAQDHALQLAALKAAGVDEVITDTISGSKKERPGLDKLLDKVRPGDTVTVWRFDRLGRSLSHLIQLAEGFKEKGVSLVSLQENIDTSSAGGELIFHIFCSLAQFERALILERTQAGLLAARAQGRVGGRPSATTPEQKAMIRNLAASGNFTNAELAKQFNIGTVTLWRILKEND